MLNPEILIQAYRRIKSRKVKAVALETLRRLGMRYLVVRMDTINLCNLRCRMCYYSSDYNRKKDEMDLPLFRKIAGEVFPKTRFLYLSCATEPLMNKHFADFLRATSEYKVPFTSFCTNGQLLKKEVIQASIESKTSEIIFSIDGATAETYEYIRRGGKWDKLLENLDLLASMKRQASTPYPKARINFTCMLRNIRELPAMVQFAAGHDARGLHVRHLLSYADEEKSCREQMTYTKVFNSVAQEARKEAESRGVDLFLPDLIPERGDRQVCAPGSRREANPYCLLPWFHAIISWKGDYRVCSIHQALGNLREQTFAEIHNTPRLGEIRHKMLWRAPDACSWNCREEAYDVPAEGGEERQDQLVSLTPSEEA
jgi:MoaA/NifB/PqqE/SkfB family radical SAM enzyme